MRSSSPSAFPISSAACSARARSIRRSCRCLPSAWRAKARTKRAAFARQALSGLTFVLGIFSVLAILAMPWLMMALAPGFVADQPEKYNLAVVLTQIAFPYLLCMSLVALLSGVLNSLQSLLGGRGGADPAQCGSHLGLAARDLALGYADQPEGRLCSGHRRHAGGAGAIGDAVGCRAPRRRDALVSSGQGIPTA